MGQEIKEYVIKDNLLRRQLTTEQKWNLIAMLSEVNEVGRGGDRKSEDFKEVNLTSLNQIDVLTKTARETGVSEKTVQRARAYREIIKSPQICGFLLKNKIKILRGGGEETARNEDRLKR